MKERLPRWFRLVNLLILSVAALIGERRALAESLPLQRAIELALAHSTTSAIANADLQRTYASYREIRNNYLPQLVVGSGLGWSYGFPLSLENSAPSLVNVVAQSTVFNPAQHQFMNAARTEWQASQLQGKDQRNAVIQDVAVSYAELAKWEARITRLQSDETQAQQMQKAVAERVQEGVDSAVDLNKAKLTSARVRLHMAEARGSADVLRRHLAELTGLPLSSIELAPETIPALPPVASDDNLPDKAVAVSPVIKFAEQHALAESMRASAEHRALLPSFDFAAQYARLSTFNNYDQYYKTFQPNNVTIGMSFRFPLFNASQRARAQAADAEALKAKKQAEASRNQVQEETLKLQRAAEQLEAAREVAQLEYQLAQSSLDAAQIRVDAKTGTLHELADARAQANERYLAFQDADFEYQRVRLSLLRATGDLEKWALQAADK
ncbi:MAG: TolC family protein [Acidobacteriia bacterium]|nr:TolC family protein [Terriglobia bacterium]